MKSYARLCLFGCTASLVLPAAAIAEVSALDVWGSWKSYVEGYGYEVEVGNETTAGGTLRLDDVAFNYPVPGVDMKGTLEFLEFRERGDGTVAITMATDLPFSMSADPEEGAEMDIAAIMRHSGLNLVASGEPDEITYNYVANSMSLDFDKFVIEGEEVEPVVGFTMQDLKGMWVMMSGDGWNFDGESAVGNIVMNMSFEDPNEGNAVNATFSASDVVTSSSGRVPSEIDPMDPDWILNPDFHAELSMQSGPMEMQMEATGEENFAMSMASDAGSLSYKLSGGYLDYSSSSQNARIGFASPDLPFPPVSVSFAETGSQLAFPMTRTEEPVDFRLMVRLLEMTTDDFIWDMFDPAGSLPRDGASLVIDIDGLIRPLINFTNPAAAQAVAEERGPEIEIYEMNINEILLEAIGARIEGAGAFTFDNSDTTTFDGIPAPTGEFNIDMFGINGLLDTLTNMGFLPPDQATGARMMMGAFARPGDGGPDHLTSKIRVNGDGTVFANDMQLQ